MTNEKIIQLLDAKWKRFDEEHSAALRIYETNPTPDNEMRVKEARRIQGEFLDLLLTIRIMSKTDE